MRWLLLVWLSLAIWGCGARTSPLFPGEAVQCPGAAFGANIGQTIPLSVRVPAGVSEEGLQWTIDESPPGGDGQIIGVSTGTRVVNFMATVEGTYRVRVRLGDPVDAGVADASDPNTCTMAVIVGSRPPNVTCPARIDTIPLAEVRLEAQVTSDRMIQTEGWVLGNTPAASSRPSPSEPMRRSTTFRPDVAGDYFLRYEATDVRGRTGTCTTLVHAEPTEALRVEMFWNSPNRSCRATNNQPGCDRTDVDLHLLRNSIGEWRSNDDCYFGNCTGQGLSWDGPTRNDDPRLDLDDVDGFGPENINLNQTGASTYRIAVHMFDDHEPGEVRPAETQVVVYCFGDIPRTMFGPVRVIERGGGSSEENDIWLVADVVFRAGRCTVVPISRNGNPWLTTQTRLLQGDRPSAPLP